ncbi:MAG: signal peptidase I [Bifidobacteriaceae bacterium]|jgi:signal peptidase|nr:signal peptidase I [Bifidobacteriaceae bacterium]
MSASAPTTPARGGHRAKPGPARRAISWLATGVMVVLLALAVALAVIPSLNHGKALTVLTGSMQPALNPGDVAVVFAVDGFDDIELGDVVTYMPNPDDPTLVTHRAVAWTTGVDGERRLVVQGDANNTPDDPIKEVQLKAKLAYTVPWVGNVLKLSPQGRSKAMLGLGVGLLCYAGVVFLVSLRRTKPAPPASLAEASTQAAPAAPPGLSTPVAAGSVTHTTM